MHGRVIWILIKNTSKQIISNSTPQDVLDKENVSFSEPWQAQAFAIVITLSKSGYFTWKEWSKTLSEIILRAEANGGPDDGSDYYLNWVTALEQILESKGLADVVSLTSVKGEWEQAYKSTPHGEPVSLNR